MRRSHSRRLGRWGLDRRHLGPRPPVDSSGVREVEDGGRGSGDRGWREAGGVASNELQYYFLSLTLFLSLSLSLSLSLNFQFFGDGNENFFGDLLDPQRPSIMQPCRMRLTSIKQRSLRGRKKQKGKRLKQFRGFFLFSSSFFIFEERQALDYFCCCCCCCCFLLPRLVHLLRSFLPENERNLKRETSFHFQEKVRERDIHTHTDNPTQKQENVIRYSSKRISRPELEMGSKRIEKIH